MHRAAHLFVEQDVFGVALDAIVGPDADFAQASSAWVGVEDGVEEVFAALGAGFHDQAVLERERDAIHLTALVDGGKLVPDTAVDAVLDRRREDLAVGHVFLAVGGLPDASGRTEGEVGVRADDANVRARFEPGFQGRQPRRHFGPVDVGGAVQEIGVLAERHLRLLGQGIGGVVAQDPADVFDDLIHDGPARDHRLGQTRRVGVGQCACVFSRADADGHLDRVGLKLRNRIEKLELLIASLGQEYLLGLLETHIQPRVPARRQDAPVAGHQQRLSIGGAVDDDQVARTDFGRVLH